MQPDSLLASHTKTLPHSHTLTVLQTNDDFYTSTLQLLLASPGRHNSHGKEWQARQPAVQEKGESAKGLRTWLQNRRALTCCFLQSPQSSLTLFLLPIEAPTERRGFSRWLIAEAVTTLWKSARL